MSKRYDWGIYRLNDSLLSLITSPTASDYRLSMSSRAQVSGRFMSSNSLLTNYQSHLQDYFDRFGNFRYDSSQPTMSQFQSLSQQTGWSNDVYKQEKKALQTALVLQFNDIYGESESDMDNWEELCNAMDVDPMPRTVKQCKRVRRRV